MHGTKKSHSSIVQRERAQHAPDPGSGARVTGARARTESRKAEEGGESRRTYILKADGRQRPLAVAALEVKVVQRATVDVLNSFLRRISSGSAMGSDRDADSTMRWMRTEPWPVPFSLRRYSRRVRGTAW